MEFGQTGGYLRSGLSQRSAVSTEALPNIRSDRRASPTSASSEHGPADQFRDSHRNEMILRVQIILPGLIEDPDATQAGGGVIGNGTIELPEFQ
jgi:hypothetical protein